MSTALGDLATWVGAAATVGLLVGAVITADYAIRAFREQTEEVKVLKGQFELATKQFTQDMERRRQAQAAKVFLEAKSELGSVKCIYTAIVHNAGDVPIYQLEVNWYKGTTQLERRVSDQLKFLMPDVSHPFPREDRSVRLKPVVCFYDSAGIRWQRGPDRELKELGPS